MSGPEKFQLEINLRMGNEMSGHWVEPMNPEEFLDESIPKAGITYPGLDKKGFGAVAAAETAGSKDQQNRHNDIRDYKTVIDTNLTEDAARSSGEMVSLHHYPISFRETGRPLNKFTNNFELAAALADVMEAYEDARDKANILHRDISAGNIIITRDGRGLLVDCDLCVNPGNKENLTVRKPNRTGTWEFMSAATLTDPTRLQDHLDDKESAFHVLIWTLLRYTLHNKTHRLADLTYMFDQVLPTGDKGGTHKIAFLVTSVRDLKFDNKLVDDLVKELVRPFAARYTEPLPAEVLEEWKRLYPTITISQLDKLNEPTWFSDTLRKYTEKPGWPLNDRREENEDDEMDDDAE